MTTTAFIIIDAIIGAIIGGLIGCCFYILINRNKNGKNPCNTCKYYSLDCNCNERRSYDNKVFYNQVSGTLSLAFMTYLEMNKPGGKMCLSDGECADIDKAFEEQDWEKLFRYIQKYGAYTTS